MTENELLVVLTTSDLEQTLEQIAAELISDKLAACCQISGPVRSFYQWEGKLENSREWVCQIKTVRSRFAEVSKRILELHHYSQPQIIALPVTESEAGYGVWVRNQVSE